jgi:SAM-dependent methyltransferase
MSNSPEELHRHPDYNVLSPADYLNKINTPAKDPEYFRRFHQPLIEEAKREARGNVIRVLDVACGFAFELDFVKDDPQVQIVGVDLAGEVLHQARARFSNAVNTPIFIQADVQTLSFAVESIDVGIAVNAFSYKPYEVLAMLYSSLKRGSTCAMNFRVYGNTFNEAFFQNYVAEGAMLEDEELVINRKGNQRSFKLKALNYRNCSDEQTRKLDRQIFFCSLTDIKELIKTVGFEILENETFHFPSPKNPDNEMDVFTMKKPSN